MKSKLNLDCDADVSQLTEAQQSQVRFRFVSGKMVTYYPMGTEFDGDSALFLCKTGQATPSDDECFQALGMTQSQIDARMIEYKMDSLGINSKDDRDLYRAGVIAGYNKDLTYIHGPNWAAYQDAKAAAVNEDDLV